MNSPPCPLPGSLLSSGLGAGVNMVDKKPPKPPVAESPIADVFEGRHPSPGEKDWAEETLAPTLEKAPEKPIGAPTGVNLDELGHARFTTISGVPIRRLYTEADLPEAWSTEKYLGHPGQPPFTRGIHASGYRGKLFTMRQFSGFASPEETNQRYKYLLEHGGSGLSVAFDLPTLMGYDSDHPASEGEVGKCGVAIDSLEDMEILFSGIDLGKTTVSMTINSPASVLWAMYLVVAEKQGDDWRTISAHSSPFSSMRTAISSKKSLNTAPLAASGIRRWSSAMAPKTRAPGLCVSTHKRRAAPSLRNSLTTT